MLTLVAAQPSANAGADTAPGARPVEAVRRRSTPWESWEVDAAVISAAEATEAAEARDQLVPALITAHSRQATGYDRLRAAVCADGKGKGDGEEMSPARSKACSTLSAGLEEGWRRRDRTEQWVVRAVATAAYAGAIKGAAVERDASVSRGISTAAGVPMGAVVGIVAFGALGMVVGAENPAKLGHYSRREKVVAASLVIGGAIAGGLAGGWEAHRLGASPSARAPLTAAALAPVYVTTLVMTFD
ncbi:MAG TPA: hypothetical protein VGP07_01610 [Polyangia bacterium]